MADAARRHAATSLAPGSFAYAAARTKPEDPPPREVAYVSVGARHPTSRTVCPPTRSTTSSAPPRSRPPVRVHSLDTPYSQLVATEAPAPVGDRCPRGVVAGRAVHAAAGVGRRRAEVEPADRRLGATQPGHRPEHQLLVELRRAAVDRTADEVGVPGFELDAGPAPGGPGPATRSRAPVARSGAACGRRTAGSRRRPRRPAMPSPPASSTLCWGTWV